MTFRPASSNQVGVEDFGNRMHCDVHINQLGQIQVNIVVGEAEKN